MDNILLGGLASSCATVFTNPLEVIKTRLQLQGELKSQGKHTAPYKSVFQAFTLVVKNDGILALQKGLAPSLMFQFILNGCRLGIYTTALENGFTLKSDGSVSVLKSAFYGGLGGFIGQAIASPFFMLRTQLMSQAQDKIAVGYQHKHKGMISALISIYKKSGFTGLYRGVAITLPRGMIGSGTQIGTFGITKDYLSRTTELNETVISILSGAIAGTTMAVAMNPADVLATRMYNQGVDSKGKGIYYSGVMDCLVKVFKTEGFAGFYKGFWPHYIRIGPHSALVLVFFDEFKLLKTKLTS